MAITLLKKLGESGFPDAIATPLSCHGHHMSPDGRVREISLQDIVPLGFANLVSDNPKTSVPWLQSFGKVYELAYFSL